MLVFAATYADRNLPVVEGVVTAVVAGVVDGIKVMTTVVGTVLPLQVGETAVPQAPCTQQLSNTVTSVPTVIRLRKQLCPAA